MPRDVSYWVAAHLTGIFEIKDSSDNLLKKGSRGAGLSINRGVRTAVRRTEAQETEIFFDGIKNGRDRAMFMLMLRCELRVEEVANLSLAAIDSRRMRLCVFNGKGQKDRMVYISRDTYEALATSKQPSAIAG